MKDATSVENVQLELFALIWRGDSVICLPLATLDPSDYLTSEERKNA